MATVVNNEQCVLRFVFLDQLAKSHHELQMRVLGWDGKDVSAKGELVAEAFLQVL